MTGVDEADGRVRRGQRNKEAVVTALLALIEEGDLQPRARDIAARAGLSLRSVFSHFDDVEALYCEAGTRTLGAIEPMLAPADPLLPLADRVAVVVSRRVGALEVVAPVASAARLREPFSAQLRANRDAVRQLFLTQIECSFAAELGRLDGDERRVTVDALLLAGSFAAWYTLREEHGLTVEAASAVLQRTVEGILSSTGAAQLACRDGMPA
ncbi:TetR/AcrR family transcriptional regulator [Acidiferrimicrobium sp. IK]|uniref:TetR/AcrR family transcriptional regulator n=1 Tax=Acidiferrimicrobium sp. IK TaxID=2871700 RepID=UPI0021CB4F80|nr:TetR/AcrR family transcriptional regulator [Acidiferrimicrobium sp. IK]MCU4183652.1 TetR/AcrR family transcriptional regulator [Acidiferrimicrobium sp. IK]